MSKLAAGHLGKKPHLDTEVKLGATVAALLGTLLFPHSALSGENEGSSAAAGREAIGRVLGVGAADAAEAPIRAIQPTQVKSSEDLLKKWSDKQNLYVQGDIAEWISDQQLQQLNGWLRANHSNWTVYLAATRTNQRINGDTGIDADGWILGPGLPRETGFGEIRDPTSSLQSAALLMISFDPRDGRPQIIYKGSDLYDKFGLDEDTFWKRLYLPAKEAMNDGDRVYDAVVNTIKGIDGELQVKLAEEAQLLAHSEAQKVLTAQAESRRASLALAKAQEDLTAVQTALKALIKNYPDLTGELAHPNFKTIREDLASAQAANKRQDSAATLKAASKAQSALDDLHERVDGYPKLRAETESTLQVTRASFAELKHEAEPFLSSNAATLGARISSNSTALVSFEHALSGSNLTQTLESLRLLQKSIGEDRELLRKYYSDDRVLLQFGEKLDELRKRSGAKGAQDQLHSATLALAGAKELYYDLRDLSYGAQIAELNLRVKEVGEKVESNEKNAKTRNRILGFLSLGLLGTSGLAALFTWPKGKRVKDQIKESKTIADEKLIKWLELNDRKDQILGKPSNRIQFSGETGRMADELLKNMGKARLNILAARELLDSARKLTKPSPVNAFFTGNFYRAAALLTKPIRVDAQSAVGKILAEGQEDEPIWADLSAYEPKEISFQELMEDFNTCTRKVEELLARIDDAVVQIGKKTDALSARVEALVSAHQYPAEGGEHVNLWRFPDTMQKVGDRWTNKINAIGNKAASDPVASSKALDKIAEVIKQGEELTTLFLDDLTGRIVQISAEEAQLSSVQISLPWVKTRVNAIVADANQYLNSLEDFEAEVRASSPQQFAEALEKLHTDLVRTKGIAGKLVTEIEARVPEVLEKARMAQSTLAKELGLDQSVLLVEPFHNPVTILESAISIVIDAKDKLTQGELDRAEATLNQGVTKVLEADEVIKCSLTFVQHKAAEESALQEIIAELERELPSHQEIVDTLKTSYHADVLLLGTGDSSHPRADGTIANNCDEAKDDIAKAKGDIDSGNQKFLAGEIIQAAFLFERAEASLQLAHSRLDEIGEKARRITGEERSTETLLQTVRPELTQLTQELLSDTRVMGSSRATYSELLSALDEISGRRAVMGVNPFEVATEAAALQVQLTTLKVAIEQDRKAHAKAAHSLDVATQQIKDVKTLLVVADSDRYQDSETIRATRSKYFAALGHLNKLKEEFAMAKGQDGANWGNFDMEADRLNVEATNMLFPLKSELQTLDKVLKVMSDAKQAVNLADDYSGRHGATIDGEFGLRKLEAGLEALKKGEYDKGLRLLTEAESEANNALDRAREMDHRLHNEILAKQRAEAQEREVARKALEESRREAERKKHSDYRPGTSLHRSLGSRSSGVSRSRGL